MAITSISRDWGVDPSIVRITTTDTFTTITTTGYYTTQLSIVSKLNNGDFEWINGDVVAIYYNGGDGIFTYDSDNQKFLSATGSGTASIQYITIPMTAADWIAMYNTPLLLLPAPGPGKVIYLMNTLYIVTYGTMQYTSGGNAAIQYGNTPALGGVLASYAIASATINATNVSSLYDPGTNGALQTTDNPLSEAENLGLYLTNDTGSYASGNSTFLVNLWYTIIST